MNTKLELYKIYTNTFNTSLIEYKCSMKCSDFFPLGYVILFMRQLDSGERGSLLEIRICVLKFEISPNDMVWVSFCGRFLVPYLI